MITLLFYMTVVRTVSDNFTSIATDCKSE